MSQKPTEINQLAPGIYQGIHHTDYNRIDALRNSYLKKLSKCPANVLVEDDEESKALIFGRAAHSMVLEGEGAFASEFIVMPEDAPKRPTSRQIEAKKPSPETLFAIDWWNQFNASTNGKTIITRDDYESILGVKNAVEGHPFARTLLGTGVSESTVIAELDVNGTKVRCKVRPDRTPAPAMRVLLDLKTCEDASYDGFIRNCKRFGYFQQAAYYIDCYNAVRALPMIQDGGVWRLDRIAEASPAMDAFAFIAVEKKTPFRCEVYTLGGDNTFLLEGREQYRAALETELECRRRGSYPHYQNAGCQELVPYSERGM